MFFEEINRIQKMDKLIRLNSTGNAEEFASKLGISRRQVYNIMESLKEVGLDIVYDRHIRSYVYTKSYKLVIFEITELTEEESERINAGAYVMKTALCNAIAQITYSFGS